MPHVYEAYSSIQGEGPHVGVRQVFLRVAGCSLGCVYCDTLDAKRFEPDHFLVETEPGAGTFTSTDNPVGIDAVLDAVDGLWTSCTHSVSVTGGEPMQFGDLPELVAGLAERGRDVYLETAGPSLDLAGQVADDVAYLSLDWKLPSHGAVPEGKREDLLDRELSVLKRFLDAGAEAWVKAVLMASTTEAELHDALSRLEGVDVPVVLTPVTPMGEAETPSADQVQALARAAGDQLGARVRVIPQMHRAVGVL